MSRANKLKEQPKLTESKVEAKEEDVESGSESGDQDTLLQKVTEAEAKLSVFDAVQALLAKIPSTLVLTPKQSKIYESMRTQIYLDMTTSVAHTVADIGYHGLPDDEADANEAADDKKTEASG